MAQFCAFNNPLIYLHVTDFHYTEHTRYKIQNSISSALVSKYSIHEIPFFIKITLSNSCTVGDVYKEQKLLRNLLLIYSAPYLHIMNVRFLLLIYIRC